MNYCAAPDQGHRWASCSRRRYRVEAPIVERGARSAGMTGAFGAPLRRRVSRAPKRQSEAPRNFVQRAGSVRDAKENAFKRLGIIMRAGLTNARRMAFELKGADV